MKNRILSLLLCLVMITTVFAVAVPANVNSGNIGLIAYWDFDEGTGTVAHDDIGGNHGAIDGAQWVPGISGHALSFDGVNDYVEVPYDSSLDLTEFTIEAWIKVNAVDKAQCIITKGYGGDPENMNYEFIVRQNNKVRMLYEYGSGTDVEIYSTQPVSINEWSYFVASYGNSKFRLYKNGMLENEIIQTNQPGLNFRELYIGVVNNPGPMDCFFNGAIDEVRIWDRVLSPSEIEDYYSQMKIGAHWKFDENSGNIAYDSINNNDGTIYGATRTSGISGNALSFDGINDYVLVPDDPSLDITDGATIECWLKLNDLPDIYYYNIIGKGTSPIDRWRLDISSYGESLEFKTGNNIFIEYEMDFILDTWYYIVVTWDTHIAKMYINGINVGSDSTGGFSNPSANIFICSEAGVKDYVNGIIDEIRIWNRALTEEEIQSQYGEKIPATIDIDPDTLNLGSKGKWITAYIYFPDGWNPQLIDFTSIRISAYNEEPCDIPAVKGAIQWEPGGEYGEFDTRCMAKFSRAQVQELLEPGTYVFKVEGELLDGTHFEGLSDEITVINPP